MHRGFFHCLFSFLERTTPKTYIPTTSGRYFTKLPISGDLRCFSCCFIFRLTSFSTGIHHHIIKLLQFLGTHQHRHGIQGIGLSCSMLRQNGDILLSNPRKGTGDAHTTVQTTDGDSEGLSFLTKAFLKRTNNPPVKNQRFLPAPFTQGEPFYYYISRCTESFFFRILCPTIGKTVILDDHHSLPCAKGGGSPNGDSEGLSFLTKTFLKRTNNPPVKNQRFLPAPFTQGGLFMTPLQARVYCPNGQHNKKPDARESIGLSGIYYTI